MNLSTTDVVHIACCPIHGLHGKRTECFVCGGPVQQVAITPVPSVNPDRSHPEIDQPGSGSAPLDKAAELLRQQLRTAIDQITDARDLVGRLLERVEKLTERAHAAEREALTLRHAEENRRLDLVVDELQRLEARQ